MSDVWLNIRFGKWRLQIGGVRGVYVKRFNGLDNKWEVFSFLNWHF